MAKSESFKKIGLPEFEKLGLNRMQIPGLALLKRPVAFSESMPAAINPVIASANILLLCKEGNARVMCNLKEYSLQKNTLLFVLPNFLFQVLEESEDFLVECIAFSFDLVSDIRLPEDIAQIVQIVEIKPCLSPPAQQCSEFHQVIELMKEQYHTPALYRDSVVRYLLLALLHKVSSWFSPNKLENHPSAAKRDEEIYRRFMSLLFKHYREKREVRFYADKLFVSPKYASKIITRLTGKSPQGWIQEMVITGAKAMIKGSNMSISQIANELNFANQSFFGTFFRKHTGMSPLEYRQF